MRRTLRLASVRPLVRYVDEDQAVIDAHLQLLSLPNPASRAAAEPDPVVEVLLEIEGADGFRDEGRTAVRLTDGGGSVRFEVVQPERWWPAGMGGQSLYELRLSVVADDEVIDQRTLTLGFTSVRQADDARDADEPRLLVNGQVCSIRTVVPVDRIDESQLLPAAGDSLLLVRDHYGPDLLYQAADHAGILLIQCVPIHPEGMPESEVDAQVDRLASHPSLAGWFVGHLGRLSDRVAARLRALDPTRHVFRRFPLDPAA